MILPPTPGDRHAPIIRGKSVTTHRRRRRRGRRIRSHARRRLNEQAEIILLEKDEYVSFANCGLPYYIGEEITDRSKLLIAGPELFKERFNIDVRTFHEATAIDRQRKVVRVHRHDTDEDLELAYDKLILAPGAAPLVPPIDGVDAPNVFTLRNLADTDRIKQHVDQKQVREVVVVGAGFIGLEMVEQLVQRQVKVKLVELMPHVLPLLDPEMAQPLHEALASNEVQMHVGDGIACVVTNEQGRPWPWNSAAACVLTPTWCCSASA